MEEILKSCPFCGSKNLQIAAQKAIDNTDILFIHCKNCDACGPSVEEGKFDFDEAIDAWNKRS